MATNYANTQNRINNYSQKFGMTNILTDAEKSSYKEFANKIHNNTNNADLFKLYTGSADELTSEQMDIVAWEIKIREIESLKRQHIDPNETFKVENYHKDVGYDPECPDLQKRQLEERAYTSPMTDELLEQSKRIIENTPVRVNANDLHKQMGGGVNMLAKKYIVEDNNGHEISVNNANIQEHFRKMYIKRMSEVTGIDYTQYDLSSDDNIDYYDPNKASFDNVSKLNEGYNTSPHENINLDDYEDD